MMQVVKNQTQHDIMESLDKGFQHTTINNKVSLFDDERQNSFKNNKDASHDEEHMWNLFTFIQTVDMTQHETSTSLEEMGDDGMEAMVKLERPIQIINPLIENQANNIVFGESFLILMIQKTKCGVLQQKKKEARNEIFFNYKQQDCLKMFQSRTQGMVRHNRPLLEKKKCWEEIKSKIDMDPTFDHENGMQLWQLLDQFQDVFAQNKRKLGCYNIGEHTIDTRIFSLSHYPKQIIFLGRVGSEMLDKCFGFIGRSQNTSKYA